MELSDLLFWILGRGGAAIATYWLMEHIAFLVMLAPQYKRFVSYAIAGVIVTLAFLASVGMGYQPEPETTRAWIQALSSVIGVAIGLSQLIHGVRILPMKAKGNLNRKQLDRLK